MKYSVIIPVYNAESTIVSTVTSILDSGLIDFEILLIDDGSSDRTPVLCDHLEARNSNIRCVHQANMGVSGARNRGIQEATGEYLLFFDSDDTVDSGAFAHAALLLHQCKPDMLLFGMSFDYYSKGKRYRRDDLTCEQKGLFSREAWQPLVMSLYQCNYLTSACNKFVRRSLVEAHKIRFSESMHLMEDCLFTLQCLEHCETIYLIPEAIYRYQQSEDEGNAARRLERIDSLVDYMEHFSNLPQTWRSITDSIYYMLLHQKISASGPKKIAAIAADHKRSSFIPQTERDRWLCEQLSAENYLQLYLRNLKIQARHKAAVFAKSHGLYKQNKK